MNGKKVLITGANGLVGNYMVQKCIEKGAFVTAVDIHQPKNPIVFHLSPHNHSVYPRKNGMLTPVDAPFFVKQHGSHHKPELHFSSRIRISVNIANPEQP